MWGNSLSDDVIEHSTEKQGNRYWLYALLLLGSLMVFHSQSAKPFGLRPLTVVAQCDGRFVTEPPVDFSGPHCQSLPDGRVDPQQRLLWLSLPFEFNTANLVEPVPQALFIAANAASVIYLNGKLIGKNGQPAMGVDEVAGRIDSNFYLPPALLQEGKNQLVVQLSSQHGWWTLAQPVHFIGIGPYAEATTHVQQYSELALVLLGILLTGALYYSVLALQPLKSAAFPSSERIFVLVWWFAALQLGLEISRGLFGYLYPLHHWRLLAILLCGAGFGLSLLWLIARRYQPEACLRWFGGVALCTATAVMTLDGFDNRTAVASLIPVGVAALLAAWQWYQSEDEEKSMAGATAMLLAAFVLLYLWLPNDFQEIVTFLLTAVLLCCLFIEQALLRSALQRQQWVDQQLILRLRHQLQQSTPATKPTTLTLQSAGKVVLLSVADIAYCQAARDYCEIHLHHGQCHLYSGTLKQLENELPEHFLRVHRSYLVNVELVCQFSTTADAASGSGAVLQLSGGQQVPVSRRLIPAVRSAIQPDGAV